MWNIDKKTQGPSELILIIIQRPFLNLRKIEFSATR